MKESEFIQLIKDCDLKAIEKALDNEPALCNAKSSESSAAIFGISIPGLSETLTFSALHVAAYGLDKLTEDKRKVRKEIIEKLLDSSADVAFVDSLGFNFLQSSIFNCARTTVDSKKSEYENQFDSLKHTYEIHFDIAKKILSKQNDAFIQQSFNSVLKPRGGDLAGRPVSCLNLAIWAGHKDLVNLILSNSQQIEPIEDVISIVHEAIILLLHDEQRDDLRMTRFEILEKILQTLKQRGNNIEAFINKTCENDYNTEVDKGSTYNIMGGLLGWSQPTNYNAKGGTPLHTAVKFSKTDNGESVIGVLIVQLLLAYNADPTIQDAEGKTPKELAKDLNLRGVVIPLSKKSIIASTDTHVVPPANDEVTVTVIPEPPKLPPSIHNSGTRVTTQAGGSLQAQLSGQSSQLNKVDISKTKPKEQTDVLMDELKGALAKMNKKLNPGSNNRPRTAVTSNSSTSSSTSSRENSTQPSSGVASTSSTTAWRNTTNNSSTTVFSSTSTSASTTNTGSNTRPLPDAQNNRPK